MAEARRVISLSAYARHRGTSRQYISRLAKEGVLVMRDGFVEVEASDAVLDDRPTALEVPSPAERSPSGAAAASSRQQPITFAQAKLAETVERVKLLRMERERRAGKLLNRDDVQAEQFNAARIIRDGMVNLPDRVCGAISSEIAALLVALGLSADLARTLDMSKIHSIISKEVRSALNETAGRLADEPPEDSTSSFEP